MTTPDSIFGHSRRSEFIVIPLRLPSFTEVQLSLKFSFMATTLEKNSLMKLRRRRSCRKDSTINVSPRDGGGKAEFVLR